MHYPGLENYESSLSASEVTTIWRYTNVYIIIIIIIIIIRVISQYTKARNWYTVIILPIEPLLK